MSLRSKIAVALWALENQRTVRRLIRREYDLARGLDANAGLVRGSAYFDADWYLRNNPELGDVDPARHYLTRGGFELRDPSPAFCSEEYFLLHPDVRKAGFNPLVHFEQYGRFEGRSLYELEEAPPVFPAGLAALERVFDPAPVRGGRAAVVACFFADGRLPDSLLYLLRGLREVVDRIALVGDCPIDPAETARLEGLVSWCRFGRHEQYDFGSYRRGLAYMRAAGWLERGGIDELVLINDSCYGPVYPFSELFGRMRDRPVDFWGIADTQAFTARHVSTYFAVFRRGALDTGLLEQYLSRVDGACDRSRIIATMETELTAFLTGHGLRFDLVGEEPGKTLFNAPVTFLKKYRIPLVKKKAFTCRGEESREKALAIIRASAPDLAELIPPIPTQPREHRFPTPQEQDEARRRTCRRLAAKLERGEKLNVLFLVARAHVFPARPLFEAMAHSALFEPRIAVVPDRSLGDTERQELAMEACEQALLASGIDGRLVRCPTCDELGRWPELCGGQDIVFYSEPTLRTACRYRPRFAAGRDFLPVALRDGVTLSRWEERSLAAESYAYLWRVYLPCAQELALYRAQAARGGDNGAAAGLPPRSVTAAHGRKRVRVALCHGADGGLGPGAEPSAFEALAPELLALPGRWPELDFDFCPHPELFPTLRRERRWDRERERAFWAELCARPNAFRRDGQDCPPADACLTDWGPQVAQALADEIPCCVLAPAEALRPLLAPLGLRCLALCDTAGDAAAIDRFLGQIARGEPDGRAAERAALAETLRPGQADAGPERLRRDILAAAEI